MLNKIEIFKFGFLNLVKIMRTSWSRFNIRIAKKFGVRLGVDLALALVVLVCKHFKLLCFEFLGAAPIPYVAFLKPARSLI